MGESRGGERGRGETEAGRCGRGRQARIESGREGETPEGRGLGFRI